MSVDDALADLLSGRDDAAAPFDRVRTGIRDRVADGRLGAGTRLPTVRALAERLGLAAGTVARAYRELEADGIVETRGRHGTFVSGSADPVIRAVEDAATAYAQRCRALGMDDARALEIVARALGA